MKKLGFINLTILPNSKIKSFLLSLTFFPIDEKPWQGGPPIIKSTFVLLNISLISEFE